MSGHRWGREEIVDDCMALTECLACGTYLGAADSDQPCPVLPLRPSPPVHWHVLSEDGVAYRVGTWQHGEWVPGSWWRARRELRGLRKDGEPNARLVRKPYAGWPL